MVISGGKSASVQVVTEVLCEEYQSQHLLLDDRVIPFRFGESSAGVRDHSLLPLLDLCEDGVDAEVASIGVQDKLEVEPWIYENRGFDQLAFKSFEGALAVQGPDEGVLLP